MAQNHLGWIMMMVPFLPYSLWSVFLFRYSCFQKVRTFDEISCQQGEGLSGYTFYMGSQRIFANPRKAISGTCATGLAMLTASLCIADIWSLVWYHSFCLFSMDSISTNKISFDLLIRCADRVRLLVHITFCIQIQLCCSQCPQNIWSRFISNFQNICWVEKAAPVTCWLNSNKIDILRFLFIAVQVCSYLATIICSLLWKNII